MKKIAGSLIMTTIMFSLVGWTGTQNATQTEATAQVESTTQEKEANPNLANRNAEDDTYIFELSDNVTRTQVYYKNRFGIEIAGELYMAKDADLSAKYPAIIVGAPFGGVKEQGPGVYANQLAQQGFAVLTFDPSYHGYSGGQPRMTASTTTYVEDFSAGVDYLGAQDFIDRDKIGVIGICGSGGFTLSAASMDTRIKAVVTSVMYDIPGNMNSITGEGRTQMLETMSQIRWDDFENGTAAFMEQYVGAPTETVPKDLDPVNAEFYEFYGMERGYHPNANGNVTNASMADIMTFPALEHISEINCPVLIVAGENAHSLSYSEIAYENASEPKELYVVPDANHIDLYDQVEKIPFDKFKEFFDNAFNS